MRIDTNTGSVLRRTVLLQKLQVISFVCVIVAFLAYFVHESVAGFFYLIGTVCGGICCLINKSLRKYSMNYRKEFVSNSLHPDRYEPDQYIPASIIRSTGFYPRWKSIEGSDLVETVYRGVPITFCDLCLTHKQGKSTTTDFEGTVILLTSDRDIHYAVAIQEEGSLSSERIETENQEFNSRFHISGEDITEVMYVLTPHFMEKLIQADEFSNAKTCMKFIGNHIYIMLNNGKNLFEFRDASTVDEYLSFCQSDLKYVLNYIDILIEDTALFDQSKITEK